MRTTGPRPDSLRPYTQGATRSDRRESQVALYIDPNWQSAVAVEVGRVAGVSSPLREQRISHLPYKTARLG